MNTWAFVAVVVVTLLVVNMVAFLRRGASDHRFRIYFADPDRHGSSAILLSTIGTVVGGGMFLAVGQIGFEAGLVGVVIGVAYVIGFAMLGAFAISFRSALEASQVDTLVDLLEKQYSKRVALQFSIVSAAMYFFLLAGQFVALYAFARFAQPLCVFPWVPWALVALGALSMFIYPILGGLRKDISTDVVQVLLIVIAAAAIVWYFMSDPLSRTMWSRLSTDHLSGVGNADRGYGILFLVGVLVFGPGLFLVRNDLWQRIRATKQPKKLRSIFVLAGIASCLFYALFSLVGMWAYAAGKMNAATATLDMVVSSAQSPVVVGLVVGAFFAAVMSSADTFINNASGFFARVCKQHMWENQDQADQDRRLIGWSRGFAVLVVLLGATLAWVTADIVDLLVGAFSLLLIYLPVVLGTFVPNWRKEPSAFYGPLIGVLVFFALFFLWNPKMAFAPAVLVSIFSFALIGAFARRDEST